jgi:acyl dehydratase
LLANGDRGQAADMTRTVIDGIAGLESLVGKDLGVTGWRTLRYEDIVRFADATGDHQWIHVDRERITRESPFGVPVAHGYYSLSIVAALFFELVEIKGMALVVNYGLNRVRWPAPLKEGARYRLGCKLLEVKQAAKAHDALMQATIELEGEPKPACIAEVVYRFIPLRS